MTQLRVLPSTQDASVNFVEAQLTGFLESRFVRKCDDYFIAYLSSQSGCNRGCEFCHLTATGQTSFVDSTHNDFVAQALQVLKHYRAQQKPARYVHLNFMARGEALANQTVLDDGHGLLGRLGELALDEGLAAKFNVSTIMPRTLKKPLMEIFPIITPTIYYSLYSVKETFRSRWMPGAMPVADALRMLREYQDFSKKVVKIHHPLIEGENNLMTDAWDVCDAVNAAGLRCEFNLVRYNPASPEQGREASRDSMDNYVGEMRSRLRGGKVQEIARVGFDIQASCGMFVEGGIE